MKSLSTFLILSVVLFCGMGACWNKYYPNNQQIVYQPAFFYNTNQVVYYPIVYQQPQMVPVVFTPVRYYAPEPVVNNYYLNYGSYYYHQLYVPKYNSDPWQGYNY